MLALCRGLPAQAAMAIALKLAMGLSLIALNATVNKIVELHHATGVRAENQRAVAHLKRILELLDQAHAFIGERARQFCSSSGRTLGEVTSAQDTAAVNPVSLLASINLSPSPFYAVEYR